MKRYTLLCINPSGRADLPWRVHYQTPEGFMSFDSTGSRERVLTHAERYLKRLNVGLSERDVKRIDWIGRNEE